MAPAVIGERATVMQMNMYAVLTITLTIIPFALHEFSLVYFVAALILNLLLVVRVLRLYRLVRSGRPVDRITALPLYKYSMAYLALLFLAMALDRALFI